MRVVFLGSGEFGLPTLQYLREDHEVVAVVSQPDRPSGRRRRLTPTPIAQWSQQTGLDALKTPNVNDDVKEKPMNVITPEFMTEIAESADRISNDENIKGAVITSGKDSFMAGADLKELVDVFEQGRDIADVYAWCSTLQKAYRIP